MKKSLFTLLFVFSCMGAHAQLGYWAGEEFIELTPDETYIHRYVQTMDTESQNVLNDLYAGMVDTGDESILRIRDNFFFVFKGYRLPEGNYYESPVYISSEGEHVCVLPRIIVSMKDGFEIDGILGKLGSKVIVERNEGNRYYLTCQTNTSEDVLEAIQVISGLVESEDIKYFEPEMMFLDLGMANMLTSIQAPSTKDENEEILLYSRNFEGIDAHTWTDCFPDESSYPDTYEGTEEGLAITVYQKQEQIWQPQVMVVPDGSFNLEENHDYIVRLTLKVPSDGIYQVNIGTWTNSFQNQVAVTASDDFQVIDVEFPFLGNGAEQIYYLEGCHMLFQCGWMVGTTVLKKVEVYEKVGSEARGDVTALKAVKVTNTDDAIYNLSGQRVDASYKGIVIQNGKKRIAR